MDLRTIEEVRTDCLAALRREITKDLGTVTDEDFAAMESTRSVRAIRSRNGLFDLIRRLDSRKPAA